MNDDDDDGMQQRTQLKQWTETKYSHDREQHCLRMQVHNERHKKTGTMKKIPTIRNQLRRN